MNVKFLLVAVFKELEKATKGSLSGTKIEGIAEVINRFAGYSAAASAIALVPGFGGVVSMLTQTGLVWGTYVKINQELGIQIKENVVKFIASAMLTNIATNAGTALLTYLGANIIALLPYANVLLVAFLGCMGYVLIYVSAILYLKLLTEVMKAKGSFCFDESDTTKSIIENVVKKNNVKGLIEEGQQLFEEYKASGEFDKDRKNPKCPYCGEEIKNGQKFCSKYGYQLK